MNLREAVKDLLDYELTGAPEFLDWEEKFEAVRAAYEAETKPREHITDGTLCWCEPELDYVDPETGAKVWAHRREQ